jgi:hypothetical protein
MKTKQQKPAAPNFKFAPINPIFDYMKARAAHENVPWGLDKHFFEGHYRAGIRNFFGAVIDGNGKLLYDHRQPEFFLKYTKHRAK